MEGTMARRLLVLGLGCLVGGCVMPSAPASGETVMVLVADRNIPKDFLVDETMVKFERIPRAYVQPKALLKVDELLGQISATTIFEGSQITSTMLLSREDAGTAFKIPKGYRSFTVPIDGAPAALGDVRPGNYVDLVAVRPGPKGKGTEVETLLQNVYVLAVGHDQGQVIPANTAAGAPRTRAAVRGEATSISVMLKPEEVQQVALALEVGGIRFALRSLWEGNTQVPLSSAHSPHARRTPFPEDTPEPLP